jgi:hypothetical protein
MTLKELKYRIRHSTETEMYTERFLKWLGDNRGRTVVFPSRSLGPGRNLRYDIDLHRGYICLVVNSSIGTERFRLAKARSGRSEGDADRQYDVPDLSTALRLNPDVLEKTARNAARRQLLKRRSLPLLRKFVEHDTALRGDIEKLVTSRARTAAGDFRDLCEEQHMVDELLGHLGYTP